MKFVPQIKHVDHHMYILVRGWYALMNLGFLPKQGNVLENVKNVIVINNGKQDIACMPFITSSKYVEAKFIWVDERYRHKGICCSLVKTGKMLADSLKIPLMVNSSRHLNNPLPYVLPQILPSFNTVEDDPNLSYLTVTSYFAGDYSKVEDLVK